MRWLNQDYEFPEIEFVWISKETEKPSDILPIFSTLSDAMEWLENRSEVVRNIILDNHKLGVREKPEEKTPDEREREALRNMEADRIKNSIPVDYDFYLLWRDFSNRKNTNPGTDGTRPDSE